MRAGSYVCAGLAGARGISSSGSKLLVLGGMPRDELTCGAVPPNPPQVGGLPLWQDSPAACQTVTFRTAAVSGALDLVTALPHVAPDGTLTFTLAPKMAGTAIYRYTYARVHTHTLDGDWM